jgi:hypothetical protein
VVVLLILLCAVSASAQDDKEGSKKKKGFQHQADIITQYDKEKNETKVELKRMIVSPLMNPREHVLNLTAYYVYPGKTPSKPQEVVLGIISLSYNRERKFQDARELTAELDGKQISLGTLELIDSRGLATHYKEVMGLYVPFDTFFHLVDNKKETLQMRIGTVAFELKRDHLEALRDLASRIQP